MFTDQTRLHATSVAWEDRGLLILGPSGSGKSALALQLIAVGANLVADDQTVLSYDGRALWASRPATLPHAIEARGVGLLAAPICERAKVAAAVDLSEAETARLPDHEQRLFLGQPVTVFKHVPSLYFASALLLYLKHGSFTGEDP